ncbi:MAG: HlyD family efflux transporter periplasmic adaptor subunit, partial [Pirellulaceae bacterium]|nr:HlyD family efflux transporter periplasmic adaptor subunit [Pirellulaceae bacterium]
IMTAMKTHDGRSVITMYQPHQLQIRVDVRFEDIPRVSLQQPVSINNPALKKPITGQVLFVSSEADIQKNTLQVKVSIDAPPDFFKPEMLVEVTFLAPKQENLIAETNTETRIFIPKKHIQNTETGPFVWIADRSASIAKRSFVTTGSSNGPLVEITKGLNIDSRIISVGIENLRDGDRIRIVGEDNS